eukprot:120432_1
MTHAIVDPETMGDFLSGVWKRNLEWRHYGVGFEFLRMTNSIVKIEKYRASSKDANSVHLTWSFGENLREHLKFGYVMKISHSLYNDGNSTSSKVKNSNVLDLQWQYSGEQCRGYFHMSTSTLTLNFILKDACVTFIYRIIDENTMSITCIEVDDDHTPTIQFGQMCRLNMKKYSKIQPTQNN